MLTTRLQQNRFMLTLFFGPRLDSDDLYITRVYIACGNAGDELKGFGRCCSAWAAERAAGVSRAAMITNTHWFTG